MLGEDALMQLTTRPFGPFTKTIDRANPSLGMSGALRRARGVIFSGASKLGMRGGTRAVLTFKDDAGSPANVTSVRGIWQFSDWALAVAHSTATNKAYLYRLAPTMDGWYNAAGALQSNTTPQPAVVLWTSITAPPDVWVTELLGAAYIAHNEASDGSTLSFPTKKYTTPATIATLQDFGPNDIYALGVVAFQQHLWHWGFGSGTVVANTWRPEMARFSAPSADTFSSADSITVGNKVRSKRERILGGWVAGEALFLGTPFSLTRVTGYGRTSWYKKSLDGSYGVTGPKAAVAAGDTLYYWSARGLVRCGDAGKPEPLWDAVQDAIATVINPEKVTLAFDEATDLVMVLYDAGSGVRAWMGYDVRRETYVGPDDDIGLVVSYGNTVAPIYAAGGAGVSGPAGAPTSASTSDVGNTTAKANWVSGDATAYTHVEYRRQGDTTWLIAADALSPGLTSYTFAGLSANTAYEWRAAHSKNGTLSAYLGPVVGSQFTTTNTSLNAPTNLAVRDNGGYPGTRYLEATWTNSGESGVSTEVYLAGPSVFAPAAGEYAIRVAPVAEPQASSGSFNVNVSGTYWVKIRHVRSDANPSTYVGPVSIAVTV